MQQLQHYVLFPNHDNGMRLYKELKALGVRAVISPTPRTNLEMKERMPLRK